MPFRSLDFMHGWKKIEVVRSILGTSIELIFFLIKMHCILCEQCHLQHLAVKTYVCLSEPPCTVADILRPRADNGIQ